MVQRGAVRCASAVTYLGYEELLIEVDTQDQSASYLHVASLSATSSTTKYGSAGASTQSSMSLESLSRYDYHFEEDRHHETNTATNEEVLVKDQYSEYTRLDDSSYELESETSQSNSLDEGAGGTGFSLPTVTTITASGQTTQTDEATKEIDRHADGTEDVEDHRVRTLFQASGQTWLVETDGPETFKQVDGNGNTIVSADIDMSMGGSDGSWSTDIWTYDNGEITHTHEDSETRSAENNLNIDIAYSDGRTRTVTLVTSRSSQRDVTPLVASLNDSTQRRKWPQAARAVM